MLRALLKVSVPCGAKPPVSRGHHNRHVALPSRAKPPLVLGRGVSSNPVQGDAAVVTRASPPCFTSRPRPLRPAGLVYPRRSPEVQSGALTKISESPPTQRGPVCQSRATH